MHFIYFLKSIYYLLGWGKSKKKLQFWIVELCCLILEYILFFFSFFLEYILK